jgi:hypothetical protein
MGSYWAIGCMAELYRFVAVLGIIASIVLILFTAGLSLIVLPIVFAYIVAAQFFRLMIDLAHSSRGTYDILKARSGGVRVPPSPGGAWDEDEKPKRRGVPPAPVTIHLLELLIKLLQLNECPCSVYCLELLLQQIKHAVVAYHFVNSNRFSV